MNKLDLAVLIMLLSAFTIVMVTIDRYDQRNHQLEIIKLILETHESTVR